MMRFKTVATWIWHAVLLILLSVNIFYGFAAQNAYTEAVEAIQEICVLPGQRINASQSLGNTSIQEKALEIWRNQTYIYQPIEQVNDG